MMFASKSVFQALNIITILNILEHAYRNFSINVLRGGGGGGLILIYFNLTPSTKALGKRLNIHKESVCTFDSL
jgi:hypothetical protein